MNECINSNTIGSNEVFNFCLSNKIKLIYSATSASIGNKGEDKNLSPYAFTKAKNLELLENLKKWPQKPSIDTGNTFTIVNPLACTRYSFVELPL